MSYDGVGLDWFRALPPAAPRGARMLASGAGAAVNSPHQYPSVESFGLGTHGSAARLNLPGVRICDAMATRPVPVVVLVKNLIGPTFPIL
jgi:hypothetical protein